MLKMRTMNDELARDSPLSTKDEWGTKDKTREAKRREVREEEKQG